MQLAQSLKEDPSNLFPTGRMNFQVQFLLWNLVIQVPIELKIPLLHLHKVIEKQALFI